MHGKGGQKRKQRKFAAEKPSRSGMWEGAGEVSRNRLTSFYISGNMEI
jgi:hypothetical protein